MVSETKDLTLMAVGTLVVWLGLGWYVARLVAAQRRLDRERRGGGTPPDPSP